MNHEIYLFFFFPNVSNEVTEHDHHILGRSIIGAVEQIILGLRLEATRIALEATHIPGKKNVFADDLSRDRYRIE